MARRRKMDPERKAFINSLLEHYQPKDAQDIQDMLKDLLGETLQGMLEAEMDDHLGYSKYDYKNKETDDSRNGYSPKTVTSSMGTIDLDIPRDRKGDFEPQIVKKNQTDISNIEDQVLSMYAKGMTTRDISAHLKDVYGVDASAEMISHMTDRILPIAKEWQNRPLERKYAIVFMDAVHFHVREDNRTVKKAVYVAIGVKLNGKREVLGMWVGGNESAKYWLSVLNEIKNRGVEDIMIVSVDGLTGFGDAIHAVFPQAEIQRCIVHQIRYSTKFIYYKDLKQFTDDLKKRRLVVKVTSFAYKKGIPEDSSGNGGGFVFDCRAVNNPGKYERYKPFTGLDEPVVRFLEEDGEIAVFLEHVYGLVDASVKRYMERGFTNLSVCFGCTGGQHRSVYSAQHLAEHLNKKFGVQVNLIHREQNIEQNFSAKQ